LTKYIVKPVAWWDLEFIKR